MRKMMIAKSMVFGVALSMLTPALAEEVVVSSLAELAEYAAEDDNRVRMEPGEYIIGDNRYAGEDSRNHVLEFSGSGNYFDLRGVTIKIDTGVHEMGNVYEVILTGNNNILAGLKLIHAGDEEEGPPGGGRTFAVFGDGNTIRDFHIHTMGSWPYGYGDLLGKGGLRIVNHRKHSSFLIRNAANTRVIGCTVINRAFGHSFFIQGASHNVLLKDCYAEGEMRSTDEMLAETSGAAYEVDFRSVYENREGENKITPGYMKSLNETGFRTYGAVENLRIINCHAKNVRVGFAIAMGGDHMPEIRGSTAEGCERGFFVNNAIIEDSRGDAKYGPLLYMTGGADSRIDLELMGDESEMTVHAIATICGEGHHIRISAAEERIREKQIPVMLGYGMPAHGENMSPIPEMEAVDITLINETGMPVEIGERARDCTVETDGKVLKNEGENNEVKYHNN